MTPNGIGLIEWVAEGGEPRRGWGSAGYQVPSGYLSGNEPSIYADTYVAGDIAQLWLDYRYSSLNERHKDNRKQNESASGVIQIRFFSSAQSFRFGQHSVTDVRTSTTVSDYAVFQSFMDSAAKGSRFLWFPDYENYPDEYYVCILEKRRPARRVGVQGKFNFEFHVRVLAATQYPSSVPAFS